MCAYLLVLYFEIKINRHVFLPDKGEREEKLYGGRYNRDSNYVYVKHFYICDLNITECEKIY